MLAWPLCAVVTMVVVYGLYPTYHGHALGPTLNLLYGTLARLLWGLALAWLVYSCTAGCAGEIHVKHSSLKGIQFSLINSFNYCILGALV